MSKLMTYTEFCAVETSLREAHNPGSPDDVVVFGYVPITWGERTAFVVDECDDWREVVFWSLGSAEADLTALRADYGEHAEIAEID